MTVQAADLGGDAGQGAADLKHRFRLFALQATADLGTRIAHAMRYPLDAVEEREFEDGEHKARPLANVRNCDVYVIQSLHGGPIASPNDKLCRLLFFIRALKDAGALRVTAIVPYLCYARKDRRTKANDPVTIRYVAALFESVGTDAVVSLEVHNPAAFESAFRCPTVTLTATPLLVNHALQFSEEKLCVVSPDAGGMKRAELLRTALESASGCAINGGLAEKHRSGGVISGDLFVGDVAGATVLVVDDLISTGGTLVRTARAARRAGARRVVAMATHGLFVPGAAEALQDAAIDRLAIIDSVPPFRLAGTDVMRKVEVLPSAPLVAEAILRLHRGQSLADLLVF
jgi:ribose-phosphate pyrophosphokinase